MWGELFPRHFFSWFLLSPSPFLWYSFVSPLIPLPLFLHPFSRLISTYQPSPDWGLLIGCSACSALSSVEPCRSLTARYWSPVRCPTPWKSHPLPTSRVGGLKGCSEVFLNIWIHVSELHLTGSTFHLFLWLPVTSDGLYRLKGQNTFWSAALRSSGTNSQKTWGLLQLSGLFNQDKLFCLARPLFYFALFKS